MRLPHYVTIIGVLVLTAPGCLAQSKTYSPGASDTEIKTGQTIPYSGPGSLYGVLGRAAEAYFAEINEKGGVNGRKITFLSLDDAYSPPKTVEATRRLVDQEEVLFLFGGLGTPNQSAVQRYLNNSGVPQILLNTGAARWNKPQENKWTTSGLPLYPTEGRILARYVMSQKPTAKIAILYQNGEFGKDYTNAFKAALTEMGSKATIVGEESYELTDPTIDTQLINLSGSGADVFFNVTTGRATSQSIRKLAEIGWRPLHIVVSTSVGLSILNAAGVQNATGIVSTQYAKEPGSLRWKDDPDVKAFQALRRKRFPNINPDNTIAFLGYSQAATIVHVLEECGDDLTRENVLAKATALKGYRAPSFMPRISYSTTPTDYTPIRELFVGVFDGKDWGFVGHARRGITSVGAGGEMACCCIPACGASKIVVCRRIQMELVDLYLSRNAATVAVCIWSDPVC